MTGQTYSLKRYRKWVLPLLALAIAVEGAALVCGANIRALNSGLIEGFAFLGQLFPPDWDAFPGLLKPAVDTIVIAVLGTFFGTIISLGFGLAASSNVSPRWLRNITRGMIRVERALPEIIILLFLVAAFGLGPFGGVISLTIGCIGMLGKLFADAIEEIDPASIEAIEALGASKLQVIVYGILQPIIPAIISFALFRFELNIRLSVILGAVGAGGIGLELYRAFSLLNYNMGCSALIVTLALVFMTERLSGFLRGKVRMEGALR